MQASCWFSVGDVDALWREYEARGIGPGVIDEQDVGAEAWSYMKGLDVDFDGKLTKADFDKLQSFSARGQNVLVALKPGCKGEVDDTQIAWKATKGLPYVPSPICYRGRIYLVKDGGIVSCYDAKTGDAIWPQERLPSDGNYYASPVAADGRIFVTSLVGKMTVLKAGTEKPEVLHTIDFHERIPPWLKIAYTSARHQRCTLSDLPAQRRIDQDRCYWPPPGWVCVAGSSNRFSVAWSNPLISTATSRTVRPDS